MQAAEMVEMMEKTLMVMTMMVKTLMVMTMMVTTNLWHEQWKLGGLLDSQPVAESS